ncbi:MAG: CDC27 family protein [bacterium]
MKNIFFMFMIFVVTAVSCASAGEKASKEKREERKKLLEGASESAEKLEKGKEALFNGKFSEALSLLEDCSAKKAIFFIGLAHMNLEQYEKAEKALEKSVEKKVYEIESMYNLGLIFHKRNESEKAVQQMKKVLEKRSDHHGALYFMASRHYSDENYEEAENLFMKIVEEREEKTAAWEGLFYTYIAQDNYSEAWKLRSRLTDSEPEIIIELIKTGFKTEKFEDIAEFLDICSENKLLPVDVIDSFRITLTGAEEGIYAAFESAGEKNISSAILAYIGEANYPVLFKSKPEDKVLLICSRENKIELTIEKDGVKFGSEKKLMDYESIDETVKEVCEKH